MMTNSFLISRVNKNCLNWAKTYFQQELVGIEAEKNGIKTSVSKVAEVTGDVDLNQRKGKIITIFDVEIKLEWKGNLHCMDNPSPSFIYA
jgi:activator of HSP90 ATPase